MLLHRKLDNDPFILFHQTDMNLWNYMTKSPIDHLKTSVMVIYTYMKNARFIGSCFLDGQER